MYAATHKKGLKICKFMYSQHITRESRAQQHF